MLVSSKSSYPEDPQEKVNRILAEVFGAKTDLLSEEGRSEAIRRLDDFAGDAPDAEDEPEIFDEVSPDDARTAWEVARSFCANVQIKAVLELLEKLKPLPDRRVGELGYAADEEFDALKRQIRAELIGLKDELHEDADTDTLDSIFMNLVSGHEKSLFERFKGAGNFISDCVITPKDERAVIEYLTIRGFVAQLCAFRITCDSPAREGDEKDLKNLPSIGRDLGMLRGNVRCIGKTAVEIREELRGKGVTEECIPDRIPGVEFKWSVEGLFSLLRRCDSGWSRWLESVSQDGKDGAANIRAEIDRLEVLTQDFNTNSSRKASQAQYSEPPKIAYLIKMLGTELKEASDRIESLVGESKMETPKEKLGE